MSTNTYTYLSFVRKGCVAPTVAQCRRFALRLANDHSWYKHLPLEGQGEPFFLYLSPNIQRVYVPSSDGRGGAWRDVVRRAAGGLTVNRQPGDEQPEDQADDDYITSHYLGRESTKEYIFNYGHWAYWNFGEPDQDRAVAIQEASTKLTIEDEWGASVHIPVEVLRAGLVYLRGTISPFLSYEEARYEELRNQKHLRSHRADRISQLDGLLDAMSKVRSLIFGIPIIELGSSAEIYWDRDDGDEGE